MTSPYEGDLGDWHQAHLVFSDPALRPHREFFDSLRGLTLAEQNAEIEREALRNIADHPAAYAENVVANVSRMLFNTPYSRTLEQTNDVFYALPNAILLGAALFSALVLLPRRRTLPGRSGRLCAPGGNSVRATRAHPRTRGCLRRSSRCSSGSPCWRRSKSGCSVGAPHQVHPSRVEAREELGTSQPALVGQLRKQVVDRLAAEGVDDDVGARVCSSV